VFSLVKHGPRGDMLTANTTFREQSSGRFHLKDNLVMEYKLVLNTHRLEIINQKGPSLLEENGLGTVS